MCMVDANASNSENNKYVSNIQYSSVDLLDYYQPICSVPLCASEHGGLINKTMTVLHTLLPFKHYSIMFRVPYLLHGKRPGHSFNFTTLTGN